MTRLYVVIPCYNEEEVLPETARRMGEKFDELTASGKITADSRVVFVNDGSKDRTWELIAQLHAQDNRFEGIDLSRNRGHQNALLAGLMTVRERADCVVSMDADLQDDINAIDEMLVKFQEGCDIVYGVRSSRKTDTAFKRFTAEGYYKLLRVMGVELVFNHADYRLMSRRALAGLAEFDEVNLFLRGIVPMVGYRSDTVYYERHERFAGESKYPLKKMLAFAFEGITSLSVKPIRMILTAGVLLSLIALGMLVYSLIQYFRNAVAPGWTSIMFSIWAIGGIQLIAIGVIGEYIGKVYLETKRRPRFIVREYLSEDEMEKDA